MNQKGVQKGMRLYELQRDTEEPAGECEGRDPERTGISQSMKTGRSDWGRERSSGLGTRRLANFFLKRSPSASGEEKKETGADWPAITNLWTAKPLPFQPEQALTAAESARSLPRPGQGVTAAESARPLPRPGQGLKVSARRPPARRTRAPLSAMAITDVAVDYVTALTNQVPLPCSCSITQSARGLDFDS
ncbi:hypothetical protein chiPu_0024848 [Chiloscyllium punctatum]|uniref:Uncharacterized protein n=1 Tax=Chiloscyllium punctatum TaxID=137246 RepID=A0A401TE12_CHIPU|nr:hypothetical protein [Chiloscyllium punctatum]